MECSLLLIYAMDYFHVLNCYERDKSYVHRVIEVGVGMLPVLVLDGFLTTMVVILLVVVVVVVTLVFQSMSDASILPFFETIVWKMIFLFDAQNCW